MSARFKKRALFLLVALMLPAPAHAKDVHRKTSKQDPAARLSQALVDDIDWFADTACADLNRRSTDLGKTLSSFGPRPAGRGGGFAYFKSTTLPRWTLGVQLFDHSVEPALMDEIEALPKNKRPAIASLFFFANSRALRVSEWQRRSSDFDGHTIYRPERLDKMVFSYFHDRTSYGDPCLIDVYTAWGPPGWQDAWVIGVVVSLRKHQIVTPGFIPADPLLPTIRSAFLDPLVDTCRALNTLPTTTPELIDRMGGRLFPPEKQARYPDEPHYTSFQMPGTFFKYNFVYERDHVPSPRTGAVVPVPPVGPGGPAPSFQVVFHGLHETPLIPTVAQLAAALKDERLYKVRDESVLQESKTGNAMTLLLLIIKVPSGAHPCGADIAVTEDSGHGLAAERIAGVRPLWLISRGSLDELIEDLYDPYPAAPQARRQPASVTASTN